MDWRCCGRETAEWDRVATICLAIPTFGKRARSYADFNPYRRGERAMDNKEVLLALTEASKSLPERLTQRQRDMRLQAYLKG